MKIVGVNLNFPTNFAKYHKSIAFVNNVQLDCNMDNILENCCKPPFFYKYLLNLWKYFSHTVKMI